ncbi:MAG: IS110 family transposase [Bacteroidales bacterium]|nr:IS110 family transposase [Bacteroidales bacterium]
MERIRENAAGIDIGAKLVFVALEGQPVKQFATFTEDFNQLSAYLVKHGIETVAMEATGFYWSILYEILEDAGIDVWLVDGRETKQVPGRKTDVKDCQWIQELHCHGMLNRCFVAKGKIKEPRRYQRLREDHIRSSSMHINHMNQALTEMNLRLKQVLSQIHGVSGMKMIKAILEGERDRQVLLRMCDKRIINNKKEEVLKALEGKYSDCGLFALRQAYDAYYFYQEQIRQCDEKIAVIIQEMGGYGEDKDLPGKRKLIRHHKPNVENLGANLINIFDGKDATILSGLTDYNWLQLLSEVGSDLSRWPSEKHFTSWLGLSPGQHHSGKKKKNRRKKGQFKAGQIFRQASESMINSKKIALGQFGRRIRARKGPAFAIKAMARKMAEQYWRIMVKGFDFVEQGVEKYEEQLLAQKRKTFTRLAKELNMDETQYQMIR